jgi:hypothetical protein
VSNEGSWRATFQVDGGCWGCERHSPLETQRAARRKSASRPIIAEWGDGVTVRQEDGPRSPLL